MCFQDLGVWIKKSLKGTIKVSPCVSCHTENITSELVIELIIVFQMHMDRENRDGAATLGLDFAVWCYLFLFASR